ncbi:MAG: oligosaccharide flippase family protein [Methanomassiliicoccales archaeon]|nr:oligosaccharide flippase family protein [Methanomassiliicoccales archaeon]
MTTIGRRSFVFLAMRLIAALMGYVGFYFLAKYLGPAGYGDLALVMSLVATFNALADLGFGSAHIKKISEGKDINDCVSTYAMVKIILTLVTVVVTVIALLIWATYMGGSLDGTIGSLIILFLLYNVFYNLAGIASNTYNATMEAVKSQMAGLVDVSIRIPLIVIFMLGGAGAVAAGYAYVAAALGVLLFGLYLLFRDRIKLVRPSLLREYWKFSLPLALIAVVGTVAANMPNLTIGWFYPTHSEYVGYYSGTSFFLSVFALVGSAVATMTYPSFSKLHVNGHMSEIRKMTCQAERYISIIGMPITAVMVAFPTETARVMIGGNFAAAGEPLRYLAISTMLTLLNQVHSSQILAVNRPDLSAKVTLASFAVTAVLLFLLVPSTLFGVPWIGLAYTGAAIAIMLSTGILFVIVRYVVYKLTRTGTNPRIALHVIAGVVAGLSLLLLAEVLPLEGWIQMVVYGLYSLGVFLVALWLLRELHKDDVMYFWDILNPRKLWHYIRGEMKRKEAS